MLTYVALLKLGTDWPKWLRFGLVVVGAGGVAYVLAKLADLIWNINCSTPRAARHPLWHRLVDLESGVAVAIESTRRSGNIFADLDLPDSHRPERKPSRVAAR